MIPWLFLLCHHQYNSFLMCPVFWLWHKNLIHVIKKKKRYKKFSHNIDKPTGFWRGASPKYNNTETPGIKLHQKHFLFYKRRREEGGNNHNCTGRNWLLNTMSHSIKKLTFSSLIFTHLFCTNTKKKEKNIINNCIIIMITALHWVNIVLAHKLLHSIENT